MARIRCIRGGALVEFVLTASVIFTIVGASLTALHLLFARAWVEYTAEQALYCLAEGRRADRCRTDLRHRLERVPFVTFTGVRLAQRRDSWKVNVRWRIRHDEFRLVKSLNARRVLSRAGLRS